MLLYTYRSISDRYQFSDLELAIAIIMIARAIESPLSIGPYTIRPGARYSLLVTGCQAEKAGPARPALGPAPRRAPRPRARVRAALKLKDFS